MLQPEFDKLDTSTTTGPEARKDTHGGHRLPLWTWFISFPITFSLVIGSYLLQSNPMLFGWYLPFLVSTALVFWWGFRILPGCFIGSVAGAVVLGMPWHVALVAGLTDVTVPMLAYVLFGLFLRGDFRLSDLRSITRFLLAADLIPLFIGAVLRVITLSLPGEIAPERFWSVVTDYWTAGVLGSYVVTIPMLIYFSGRLMARGLCPGEPSDTSPGLLPSEFQSEGHHLAVLFIFGGVAALSMIIPIQAQSLIYGVFIIAAALYFGVTIAIASSIWTVLLTLFLPLASRQEIIVDNFWSTPGDIHFHLLLLCTAGLIVGRTSSDAREKTLQSERNRRLLQDAEAFTRAVIEHSPIGISVRDRNGNLLLYNDAWLKIWDIWENDLDDYLHRKRDKLELDNRDSYLGTYREAVTRVYHEGGRLVIPEIQIESRRKKGVRWVSQYFQAITDAEGKVDRVVILTIDATERHRAEQAMHCSEDKYRTLWESIPLGLFRTLPSGRFLSANPAAVKMFGYNSEQEVLEILAGDLYCDPKVRVEATRSLRFENSRLKHQIQLKRKDGSTFWATSSVQATTNSRGEIIHFDGVLEDITPQRQAEQDWRESERKYRELVEHAQIAIVEDDVEGNFTFLNHKFSELLGYSLSELSRMKVFDIILPDDRDKVMRIHSDRYNDLEPVTRYEFRGLRKDGSTIYLETSVTELRHDDKITGSRAYIWDVSERKRAEYSRLESEERYRRLVENATEGIVVTQQDMVRFVNPIMEKTSGYTANEVIGHRFTEFLTTEDHDRVLAYNMQRYKRKLANADVGEIRIVRRDGSIIWYSSSSCLIEWDGAPATLTFLTDITDQRKTLQALRESEEKFRLLSEQSFMGILILQDDLIRYANEATAKIFNADQRKLVGYEFSNLLKSVHPSDVVVARRHSRQDMLDRNLAASQATYRVNAGNSGIHWVEQHCKSIEFGGKCATFVTLLDITERVDNMKQLIRLSTAVEQSATMISIVDIDGSVAFVNPEYCKVTGFTSDELVGHQCEMLGKPAREKELYNKMWEAVGARQTWSGSVSCHRKDGDEFWKRLTVSPIIDDNDELIGCLTVGEDMTREMRTQQKLTEVEKLSAVGMLAAGVAHEFRNYLAGIIGNASFARENLEESGDLNMACETLDQIVDIGEKANDLTLSLLSYSRVSAHNARPENLKDLILNTLRLVKKEMQVRSVTLHMALEDVPPVDVTAAKIQQLLINLLINAQQAIKGAGVVSVALTADDSHAYVKVADTGAGIPRENLARVFDPFFSTKGVWGKDEQHGVGMGLAICRNIAREHGGELTVESVIDKGTTFTLSLPLQQLCDKGGISVTGDRRCRIVCISLNNSVLSKYRDEAAAAGAELSLEVPVEREDNSNLPDLVICDARYAGKMELIRMAESCRCINVPYVLVNCGGLDYELDNLFETARARFPEVPSLSDLMNLLEVRASQEESCSG